MKVTLWMPATPLPPPAWQPLLQGIPEQETEVVQAALSSVSKRAMWPVLHSRQKSRLRCWRDNSCQCENRHDTRTRSAMATAFSWLGPQQVVRGFLAESAPKTVIWASPGFLLPITRSCGAWCLSPPSSKMVWPLLALNGHVGGSVCMNFLQ